MMRFWSISLSLPKVSRACAVYAENWRAGLDLRHFKTVLGRFSVLTIVENPVSDFLHVLRMSDSTPGKYCLCSSSNHFA